MKKLALIFSVIILITSCDTSKSKAVDLIKAQLNDPNSIEVLSFGLKDIDEKIAS